jgi:hypothetical protein
VNVVLSQEVNVRTSFLAGECDLLYRIDATYPIVLKLMVAPIAEDQDLGLKVELLLELPSMRAQEFGEIASI